MSDRELLELAAKAAGYGETWNLEGSDTVYIGPKYEVGKPIQYRIWKPLTDDGDALRLAVKLGISVIQQVSAGEVFCMAMLPNGGKTEAGETRLGDDQDYAATRRAIVRAAAEIGRSME